jgi:large conductance mechanosensitive channel
LTSTPQIRHAPAAETLDRRQNGVGNESANCYGSTTRIQNDSRNQRNDFMSLPFSKIDPKKHVYTLLDEFKNFAFKGNMIELAVGVIIGGAFGKIIESLVKNLLMPLISVVIGGDPEKTTKGLETYSTTIRGVKIPYGSFLAEFGHFLVLSFVVFIFIVKFLGWLMKSKKAEAAALPPPPPPADIQLLTEIRDLLKEQRGHGE